MAGDAAQRFCQSCSKTVHDLSRLTEAEIRSLAEREDAADLCIRVPIDDDGHVMAQAPAVIPAARLTRRHRSAAPVVAIVVALAACAPHVRPEAEVEVEVAAVVERDPAPMRDPDADRGHMMGGMLGRPSYKSSTQIGTGVLCDTLPNHPHGRPAMLPEEGPKLLEHRDVAGADLLARCGD